MRLNDLLATCADLGDFSIYEQTEGGDAKTLISANDIGEIDDDTLRSFVISWNMSDELLEVWV